MHTLERSSLTQTTRKKGFHRLQDSSSTLSKCGTIQPSCLRSWPLRTQSAVQSTGLLRETAICLHTRTQDSSRRRLCSNQKSRAMSTTTTQTRERRSSIKRQDRRAETRPIIEFSRQATENCSVLTWVRLGHRLHLTERARYFSLTLIV